MLNHANSADSNPSSIQEDLRNATGVQRVQTFEEDYMLLKLDRFIRTEHCTALILCHFYQAPHTLRT